MLKLDASSRKHSRNDSEERSRKKFASAALIRITKDINDLKILKACKINFPEVDDLFNFKLTISPDEGFYKDGHFVFDFKVPDNYPYDPPKVKCETEIYHPNIDLEGNTCLNILREDWKPVLCIDAIVHGLHYLLLEPNPDDPLNKSAADMLMSDSSGFAVKVRRAMTKKCRAKSRF